jgi:hypothetical protein
MTFSPTPQQRHFLLRLLFEGGGAWKKDLKPDLTKADRGALTAAKLIEEEKRGRPFYITLTDNGWEWCESHLSDELGIARNTVAITMQRALSKLHAFLRSRDLRLADLFSGVDCHTEQPESNRKSATETLIPVEGASPTSDKEIESAIHEAYLGCSGQIERVRVRLADLRKHLTQYDRTAVDAALLRLATDRRISLFEMDDPQERSSEVLLAELKTPAGDPRHLIYWGGIS